MKYLIVFAVLLFSTYTHAQSEEKPKHLFGINTTYSGFEGVGTSIRYMFKSYKIELNSNLDNFFALRLGYQPLRLEWNKLSFTTGIDLAYKRTTFNREGLPVSNYFMIEVPMELNYELSTKFSIMAGGSFSLYTRKGDQAMMRTKSAEEIRLGLGYRF